MYHGRGEIIITRGCNLTVWRGSCHRVNIITFSNIFFLLSKNSNLELIFHIDYESLFKEKVKMTNIVNFTSMQVII